MRAASREVGVRCDGKAGGKGAATRPASSKSACFAATVSMGDGKEGIAGAPKPSATITGSSRRQYVPCDRARHRQPTGPDPRGACPSRRDRQVHRVGHRQHVARLIAQLGPHELAPVDRQPKLERRVLRVDRLLRQDRRPDPAESGADLGPAHIPPSLPAGRPPGREARPRASLRRQVRRAGPGTARPLRRTGRHAPLGWPRAPRVAVAGPGMYNHVAGMPGARGSGADNCPSRW